MLDDLIAALARPEAYPHPVDAVTVHQTHISAVFLAGPFAYKVKKPVEMGFLDFRTLDRRRHFCAEEVRLNRRLAPSVYLGVVPVTRTGDRIVVDGTGDVVEWAVQMRRLPEEASLLALLTSNAISVPQIEAVARRLAAFHRGAARGEAIAAAGRFAVIAANARENFAQARPCVGLTVTAERFAALERLTEDALTRLRPLIERRAAAGVPCETHGDLRTDHVYLFPDAAPPDDVVVIDCIEFNERFRHADPVADLAFLVMDLTFHDRRDLADALADAWFTAADDAEGRPLLPFYAAYRAMVRGKVEGFALGESEIPRVERFADLHRARAHWQLAETYLAGR